MLPAPELIGRFSRDLDALVPPGGRIGIAVSGGPDSLALLLLAAATRPGEVEAATVDHGPRQGGAAEGGDGEAGSGVGGGVGGAPVGPRAGAGGRCRGRHG